MEIIICDRCGHDQYEMYKENGFVKISCACCGMTVGEVKANFEQVTIKEAHKRRYDN